MGVVEVYLSQDGEEWRPVLDTIMDVRVPASSRIVTQQLRYIPEFFCSRYINRSLILFYTILLWFDSLKMVSCEPKHVGILSVIFVILVSKE